MVQNCSSINNKRRNLVSGTKKFCDSTSERQLLYVNKRYICPDKIFLLLPCINGYG